VASRTTGGDAPDRRSWRSATPDPGSWNLTTRCCVAETVPVPGGPRAWPIAAYQELADLRFHPAQAENHFTGERTVVTGVWKGRGPWCGLEEFARHEKPLGLLTG